MVAREKTVLVSGGSGFLGGWCVAELLRQGYRVRTTVRDLNREPEVRAAVSTEVDPGDRLTVLAADLTRDDGWAEAIAGCDYVLHVASPFPPTQPKDPDELIVPAREGTLRVLRAALDADVERIVVTSSVAAVTGSGVPKHGAPLDETDWSDPENLKMTPYARSKTIAELAAWDLATERGATERLATVNPGAILGPVLGPARSFSLQMVERLLKGVPGAPRIGYSVVDVRDVADLHLRAMTAPEAGGKRFVAVESFLWMAEVAKILRDNLGEEAAKVPKRTIPNFVVRAMALADPSVRSILGQLNKRTEMSSAQARSVLGWSPRPAEQTIVDTARSLLAARK